MTDQDSQIKELRIGVVKDYFEDKGFGFISSEKFDYDGDLFFHRKNSRGIPAIKDLVVYQKVPSEKHENKLNAIGVTKLKEINHYASLIQLYLRYGQFRILKQAVFISSSRQPFHVRNQVYNSLIDNQLSDIQNDDQYGKALLLIRAFREDKRIDTTCTRSYLLKLLANPGTYQSRLYLAVQRFIDPEDLKGLNLTPITPLNLPAVPDKQQSLRNLSVPDRIILKGIKEVNTADDLRILLSAIEHPEEDIVDNYESIKDLIKVSSFIQPLLWERGILKDPPIDELKANLTLYSQNQLKELLPKLSIDDKIKIFPTHFIEDKHHFDLYKTVIKSCSNMKMATKSFEVAGILLAPELYYKAIIEGFQTVSETGLTLLRAYLIDSPIDDNLQLIRALGWKVSVKLFSREIGWDKKHALIKILKNVNDFNEDYSVVELKAIIDITGDTELYLWEQGLIEPPDTTTLSVYFLKIIGEEEALEVLRKVPSIKDVLIRATSIYIKNQSLLSNKLAFRLCNAIKKFLPVHYNELSTRIYKESTDTTKLLLWLNNHCEVFDFDLFKIYFITLESDNQKKFLKKTFFEIQNGNSEITLDDILNLKEQTIDPELSRDPAFANEKIDISVYVILQAIEDIANQELTKPDKIYNIIANQIQRPTELLVLNGFFDKCRGRRIIDLDIRPDEEGLYTLLTMRSQVPRGVKYCEGRKALDKNTKSISLCEKTGLEFWWCRNSKCFENCLNPHQSWEDYTLLDFLRIMDIEYSQTDYEVFLGYINKVNRFLEHMSCRECNHILYPNVKNETHNFGFHRVSNFICSNEKCSEHNANIYLTHCTNGRCGGIIDSRDCVRCKPAEKPDGNCGWYICTDCYACCNQQGIDRRKYIMEKTGQTYHCHHHGHKEMGIVCCTRCGTEMKGSGYQEEDYKRILDWFITNKNSSEYIVNSGTRKDGKYWFIIRPENDEDETLKQFKNKLLRYMSIGFNVPDINEVRDTYLIGEAFAAHSEDATRMLTCPACEFYIDLREDFEKYLSMSNYHTSLKFSFK